jgi:hypothetical protein
MRQYNYEWANEEIGQYFSTLGSIRSAGEDLPNAHAHEEDPVFQDRAQIGFVRRREGGSRN